MSKLGLIGALWTLIPILRGLRDEAIEANRLRRVFYGQQGVASAKLVNPRDVPARTKDDEDEIHQPSDQFYAHLERRRAALRAQGIDVNDEDDLDALERLADPK